MAEFGSTYYLQALEQGPVLQQEGGKDNSLRSLLPIKDRNIKNETDKNLSLDSRHRSMETINFVNQLKDGMAGQDIRSALNSFKVIDDSSKSDLEAFASILSLNAMKARAGVAPNLDILGLHKDANSLVVINRQNHTIGRLDMNGQYRPVSRLPKLLQAG